MSNSNCITGLQRLKPVHTAYCGLHNLAKNWSWARDVNGRDWDETEKSSSRDRDVDNFSWDETLVRLETVSRPRRRDLDHNPASNSNQPVAQSSYGPLLHDYTICRLNTQVALIE